MVALLLFACTTERSYAQDNIGTVLIVRVPRDATVVSRIRAELEANDFWVREIGPDATSARTPLPVLAGNANARAALRMQPAGAAIELWVASEGGASGGGEVVRLPGDERDDALLAVRATEAMRARGLRLPRRSASGTGSAAAASGGAAISGGVPSTTGTPPESGGRTDAASAEGERARKQADEQARAAAEAERQAEAQRQVEAEAKRRAEGERQAEEERAKAEREAQEREEEEREAEEQRQAEIEAAEADSEQLSYEDPNPSLLFIELGPAVAASQGGAKVSGAGFLNLRVQPAANWSVSGFVFVPFIGGDFENQEGRGSLRSYMLGAMFDVHARASQLEISAGAGGAMLITHMMAEPIGMLFESDDTPLNFTAAALVRAGLHVAIAPKVRLGMRAMFGLAFPELKVEFPYPDGNRLVAHWGWPFVLGALTIDWGVPGLER
jgi:hypothetical protein